MKKVYVLGLLLSALRFQCDGMNGQGCTDEARDVVVYLSEAQPKLLNLIKQKKDSDACDDWYLGGDEEEESSEVDDLNRDVRMSWCRLRNIANRMEETSEKAAILSLFTSNEDERNYKRVIEVLSGVKSGK